MDSGNGFPRNGFRIQYLAGFWFPLPSIPDSTSKHFLDCRIRITLHGVKRSVSQIGRENYGHDHQRRFPIFYNFFRLLSGEPMQKKEDLLQLKLQFNEINHNFSTLNKHAGLTLSCPVDRVCRHIRYGRGAHWKYFIAVVLFRKNSNGGWRLVGLWIPK